MLRGLVIGAFVVALLGLGGPATSEARAAERSDARAPRSKASSAKPRAAATRRVKKPRAKKAKKTTKKPRKKAVARASLEKPRREKNMPAEWTWPPSAAMLEEGQGCLVDLFHLGVHWQLAPAQHAINTPVIVEDMVFGGLVVKRTRSKGPLVMDCALARALARDAAPALRSIGVTELHVGQIHAVRSLTGRPDVMSRHSLGLAVDIYALVTADGREHLVETGYLAGDPVLHLAEILLGRGGGFRTLLTPGNDPGPHYNHFHLEARAFGDRVVSRLMRGATHSWCAVVDAVALPGVAHTGLRWVAALCPRLS